MIMMEKKEEGEANFYHQTIEWLYHETHHTDGCYETDLYIHVENKHCAKSQAQILRRL